MVGGGSWCRSVGYLRVWLAIGFRSLGGDGGIPAQEYAQDSRLRCVAAHTSLVFIRVGIILFSLWIFVRASAAVYRQWYPPPPVC